MRGGLIGQHQGKGFKQLQRETYDQLYGDLDFALYKVQRPTKTYSEHHIVSLAVKGIDCFSPTSCLDIGCGQGVITHVLSKRVDTVQGAVRTADAFLGAKGVSNASVLVGDVQSLGLKYCSIHIVHFKDFLYHTADRQGPWRIWEERVEKRASSK